MAEMQLVDARIEELEFDAILGFASWAIANAAMLWQQLDVEQKMRLQSAILPKGHDFGGESFGTAVNCLASSRLQPERTEDDGLASPAGFVVSWMPMEGVTEYLRAA